MAHSLKDAIEQGCEISAYAASEEPSAFVSSIIAKLP